MAAVNSVVTGVVNAVSLLPALSQTVTNGRRSFESPDPDLGR